MVRTKDLSAISSLLLTLATLFVVATAAPCFAGEASGALASLSENKAQLDADPEAKLALASSLERREHQLATASRPRVEAQIRERARELGISVPLGGLVDLLYQRAVLEIERDRCLLALGVDGLCGQIEASLAKLEEEFRGATGWTASEFKSGQRKAASPTTPRLGLRSGYPDYCRCGALVYSRDRFLNRYWALECNGHAGHGVCSTNLDSAHSPGQGAMTGDIGVYFGSSPRGRDCPDDHRTCFKGPKPSKPGGGEWGNVCNCDTAHSQWWDPYGSWYGGDLTDPVEVWQGSFYEMIQDGACDGQGIAVSEYIEENDPLCCDDPMGTLWFYAPVAEGYLESLVSASAENCNGGSQSGVYPYCGTFGATLRIVTDCQTYPDDFDASCYGRCGQDPPEAACSCNWGCEYDGSCCSDWYNVCYLYNP